jgi:hypothetical protein
MHFLGHRFNNNKTLQNSKAAARILHCMEISHRTGDGQIFPNVLVDHNLKEDLSTNNISDLRQFSLDKTFKPKR